MPLVLHSSSFNSCFPMSLSYELLELDFKSLGRLDPPFIPNPQKLEVDYISQLEVDYIFVSPTCHSFHYLCFHCELHLCLECYVSLISHIIFFLGKVSHVISAI